MLATRPTARMSVKAQAQQQKPSLKKAVAATATAVMLLAAPAFAAVDAEKVRPAVCASNPTAKICLKDSYLRQKAAEEK